MKRKNLLFLSITLVAGISMVEKANSSPKSNIIEVFDQFVISDTAAKQCITPSQETFSQFVTNFDVVSNFAFKELTEKHPYINKEKISKTMALKARSLVLTTEHLVKVRGCKDPDIQSMVKRYHHQARLEPLSSF